MKRDITTVYLDEDLKMLLKELKMRPSDLINQLLRNYFTTAKPKELDNKIEELRVELSALEHRKQVLVAQQETEPHREDLNREMFMKLYKSFCKRRADGTDPSNDSLWITSPRNANYCNALGKSPMEILTEIRMKYTGEQTSLEVYQ
jgi:hypothetical protein